MLVQVDFCEGDGIAVFGDAGNDIELFGRQRSEDGQVRTNRGSESSMHGVEADMADFVVEFGASQRCQLSASNPSGDALG